MALFAAAKSSQESCAQAVVQTSCMLLDYNNKAIACDETDELYDKLGTKSIQESCDQAVVQTSCMLPD